ncbi:MAG: hypothetical protein IT382_20930 [Deltaproteobacteria bacterium]|nr:hypothetical protein [Deltaproteobacteria bacterium]
MLAAPLLLLLTTQAPPAAAVPAAAAPTAAAPSPVAPAPAMATAPPARQRILVLETRADAVHLDAVRAFGDLMATLLELRTDAEVIPSSSIKDRLSVAADKASAGCDDTTCMTEIAGAMDARYVVASRASQVGGRWLMRVELFDSQDLKVIAQSTAMADSVEGLAAQAELLADDLVARAPVIARGSGGSRTGTTVVGGGTTGGAELPPPDERKGGSGWLLGGGIAALVGAVVVAGVGVGSWVWASGEDRKLNQATEAYHRDPGVETRTALIDAGRAADSASTWNNCLFAPLGCACIPLGAGGAGAIGWSMMSGGGEE